MQKTSFGRDFLLVVIGQIISLFGNAILRFALPLYLLRQTGSPALFGVVTACSFAPMVVLSMAGGVAGRPCEQAEHHGRAGLFHRRHHPAFLRRSGQAAHRPPFLSLC